MPLPRHHPAWPWCLLGSSWMGLCRSSPLANDEVSSAPLGHSPQTALLCRVPALGLLRTWELTSEFPEDRRTSHLIFIVLLRLRFTVPRLPAGSISKPFLQLWVQNSQGHGSLPSRVFSFLRVRRRLWGRSSPAGDSAHQHPAVSSPFLMSSDKSIPFDGLILQPVYRELSVCLELYKVHPSSQQPWEDSASPVLPLGKLWFREMMPPAQG